MSCCSGPSLFLRGRHSVGVTSLSQDGAKLVARFTYLPSALSRQLEGERCFRKTSIDLCLNIDVPLPREAPHFCLMGIESWVVWELRHLSVNRTLGAEPGTSAQCCLQFCFHLEALPQVTAVKHQVWSQQYWCGIRWWCRDVTLLSARGASSLSCVCPPALGSLGTRLGAAPPESWGSIDCRGGSTQWPLMVGVHGMHRT